MSKRMGFQYRQPRAKMPKLDITISSSQRIAVAGPSNLNLQNIPEAAAQAEDAWCEDEEDEIFVLASQAVEQVQANAAVVISQSMNITNNDISYSRFRQDVRTTHSTQVRPIDEFDNDEDLFSNVPDFFPNAIPAAPVTENKENNVQAGPSHQSSHNVMRTSSDIKTKEQQEKKEQLQVEYYNEKIKVQKKQIETLKDTLSKLNQKCTTKEGEASTLRYEVDSKSRDIERLRQEKMNEAVEREKQYAEKVTALEKKIESQRSELQFKNLQKKSRKSLNDSIVMEPTGSVSNLELQHLFKLHTNHTTPSEFMNTSAAEFLTLKALDKNRGQSERDFDTLHYLSVLQSLYNGAKAQKLRLLDNNMMKEFTGIANTIAYALRIYTERLPRRTPTKYNSATEYKILSEQMSKALNSTVPLPNISGAPELATCIDEKLIYEQQILAVIALLCTDFSNTSQSILFKKCEDQSTSPDEDIEIDGEQRIGSFVDILTDVLCIIGHSTNLPSHASFVESASLLLVALAKTYLPTELADILLLNLFQAIVFCEPDLRTLAHLSEFLELISDNQSSSVCSRFCISETNNLWSNPRFKIHRFSIDTCPLQIFSCLLQISFQPYGNCRSASDQSNEVTTVTSITICLIKFLRNCFSRRVKWLFRKTRGSGDSPQVSYCYCYIVSCIIVLLHFCINSWMENHKVFDCKLLKTIFAMGALFLYDIINKHYEPKVFSLGGFPVKNRLQAVHDWITYHCPFDISLISENAIKSVNLRRIPQLNEPQMLSTELQQQSSGQLDAILSDSFEGFIL